MKFKFHFFLLVVISCCKNSTAQITIDQNDFANAGDTVRLSVAVWNPLLDYSATGAAHNWDFSSLQWQNQYVDTFLNPMFVNPLYSLTFNNLPINPHRSNIAKKADNTLTTLPILSSVFTEGYNFYYKSSSGYKQRGLGMKVSGFPTAVPMTHSDTIYRLPMNFGSEDSSRSDYTVAVPQLGTYAHKQHRFNTIDGWGTLTTPFGTFDVLRVKTEIRGSDSLYIDTLNFGFKLDNDIQREYKWFGKNQIEPLLQINTQAGILGQFQNFEFVTKIVYRDSVRFAPVVSGVTEANNELVCSVFPNPSNGNFYVTVPEKLSRATMILTDMNGKILLERQMNSTFETIDASQFSKSIYILTLQNAEGKTQKKLVVQ
jgi:hypothetical protein